MGTCENPCIGWPTHHHSERGGAWHGGVSPASGVLGKLYDISSGPRSRSPSCWQTLTPPPGKSIPQRLLSSGLLGSLIGRCMSKNHWSVLTDQPQRRPYNLLSKRCSHLDGVTSKRPCRCSPTRTSILISLHLVTGSFLLQLCNGRFNLI